MLRVSVNRDVNGINSVFSALLLSMFWVFHRITSSIQLRRAMAINYVLKRAMQRVKSNGSSIEPCGTP